jgi:hypothetical protein
MRNFQGTQLAIGFFPPINENNEAKTIERTQSPKTSAQHS